MQEQRRRLLALLDELDQEMVITKDTYKGKEVVRIDDEEKVQEPPYIRKGHFRFMDLPAELRVYIYEYLLPHDMNVSFKLKPNDSNLAQYSATRHLAVTEPPEWRIEMTGKDSAPPPIVYKWSEQRSMEGIPIARKLETTNQIQTQLFLVSKAVSTEAKAVLYGSNTYHFIVSCSAHQPVSLRSPRIFGPLGQQERLPLLRNLRSISIEVFINGFDHWSVKRQRARLEYFVDILKEHADDIEKKSLLQELKVSMTGGVSFTDRPSRSNPGWAPQACRGKYMFGLESLVSLHGIKNVEVAGVPDWYAKCLQLCIQGRGGEVQETEWPLIRTKRGKAVSARWVSTRQWWQPMLNWKEFAERNAVELPENIDKYWMDDD